mmetsp:Transcript_36159/g.114990  ORF Transcript_36159/g.114990 Transcript_36159/m.114990 type:complete len:152 (+) Transcript_36159:3-458(+)
MARSAPKAAGRPAKQRPTVPLDEAERMLAAVPAARSTAADKMRQLQEIAKLAIAPVRLSAVLACCNEGHACTWMCGLPAEYQAEDCFAVDCDVCGSRDMQNRGGPAAYCHCSACSFDFCGACAVTRASQELARMLREEREQRQAEEEPGAA